MRQMEGEGEYQAATSLAQQGRRGLEELTAKYGQTGDVDRLTTSIKNEISGRINCASASAGCQPFNNCFEQRYARWLIECLNRALRGGHDEQGGRRRVLAREVAGRAGKLGFGQHSRCCWIGGHLTEPNEQKTQQSPGLGRNTVLHLLHS